MTDQAIPADDQAAHIERLRRLATSLFAHEGSDARAGLSSLLREVAIADPALIQQLNPRWSCAVWAWLLLAQGPDTAPQLSMGRRNLDCYIGRGERADGESSG